MLNELIKKVTSGDIKQIIQWTSNLAIFQVSIGSGFTLLLSGKKP